MSGDESTASSVDTRHDCSCYPDSDGDIYSRYKSRAMNEESQRFFKEALKFLIDDVINLLRRQILLIREIETKKFKQDADVTSYLDAFEIIAEQIIGQPDMANEYHKMGGFAIFPPCFRCTNSKIRAASLNLMAQICENVAYCNQIVISSDLFHLILKLLEEEKDLKVANEALNTIAIVLRNNSQAYKTFVLQKGFEVMLGLLQKDDDKLRSKTAFNLMTICRAETGAKNQMVLSDYLPILVTLISQQPKPSHEQVLKLLVMITKNNNKAIEQLKQPKYRMQDVLLECWQAAKNLPNYEEMEEHCLDLMSILNLPEIT
ncbi:uncharacterized protein LOC108744578 [Agrilus planipennis]|uniref:Uncharacterized protein LOC108744578 n=1 Tax=Agrilus planipennis TaxID=224129 RepID=A0A1W4XU32_AGRPL|nr:uncharacterized protein LOC108744578 [Agrilus planipennis]